jgi:sec-independent protein translocase protein TatA
LKIDTAPPYLRPRKLAAGLTVTTARRTLHGMGGFGIWELLVILAIAILVFGARRLPEIGAGLGNAIKNFKAGISGKDEIDVTPKKDELSDGKKP